MPDEPLPVEKEYILFCDESDKDGPFFSNFYGGLLVGATQYQPVTNRLNECKAALHLHGEVKWQKVTASYLAKYQMLIAAFFEEVGANRVKVRIMFTHNARQPTGLTVEQRRLGYWLLYYQFVKHAFGFAYMPRASVDRWLRIYFDRFPDTGEQATRFKGYVEGLRHSAEFREARLRLRREDITEVASHDHVLLQCLDIVLGSVCFRLNDKHKAKVPGSRRRGSRTIAKDELRKFILKQLHAIRPKFNIGITTGGGIAERWEAPYRHWCFQPSEFEFDSRKTKRGARKSPADPT